MELISIWNDWNQINFRIGLKVKNLARQDYNPLDHFYLLEQVADELRSRLENYNGVKIKNVTSHINETYSSPGVHGTAKIEQFREIFEGNIERIIYLFRTPHKIIPEDIQVGWHVRKLIIPVHLTDLIEGVYVNNAILTSDLEKIDLIQFRYE